MTPSRGFGFTLIETLVSITVIGLLVAIAAPVFSAVRASTLSTIGLSNCRQLAAAVELYVQQSAEQFPVTDESNWYQIGEGVHVRYSYWYISRTWPGVIYDILPLDQYEKLFVSPGASWANRRPPIEAFPPSYYYCSSFAGQPELWGPGARPDLKLQRGVRSDQVHNASAKALLFDREVGWLRRPIRFEGPDVAEKTTIAFADGHADLRRPSEATKAVPNPFDTAHDRFDRLHNTEFGVRGRDY